MAAKPQSRGDFEVAIICALPLEYDAVTYTFDKFWDDDGDGYRPVDGDFNSYTTGLIARYNVVLALLPSIGKVDAASVTARMRSSYSRLRLVLLVGICGGNPVDGKNDMFLGDVVISSIVLQYGIGCQFPDRFVPEQTVQNVLSPPNKDIRGLLALLSTVRGHDKVRERTAAILNQIQSKAGPEHRHKYEYPTDTIDQVFALTHRHMHYVPNNCVCHTARLPTDPVCDEALSKSCADLGCLTDRCVARIRQPTHPAQPPQPDLHIGIVASGDLVLKSALDRDQLHRDTGAIAFEMEAAGIWDEAPCIVIKAICDYADSHKHKGWQGYAAATAASAAKAVLERYIRTDKSDGERAREAAPVTAEASTSRRPAFNGPISGRNVMNGISVTGGTANFHFG